MEGGELARRSGLRLAAIALVVALGTGAASRWSPGDASPTPKGACLPVFDRSLGYQALAKQADGHCPLPKDFGPATVTLDGKLVKPSKCPRDPRLPGCGGRRDG